MTPAADLSDETSRLAALDALGLLDTPPEAEFDAIARLAAEATGSPTAMIALTDARRLWVKAGIGPVPEEMPRTEAFCDTVIRGGTPLVVEDATRDPRFRDLGAVRSGARFYAGLPIHATDPDGVRRAIGTLCVIDSVARRLSDRERHALDELATLAEALVASRGIAREALVHATALERQQRVFRQAERMARIGWWRLDLAEDRLEWSDGVFRIHELERGRYPTLAEGLDFYPPDARAVVSSKLAHTIETGEPFDFEVDFITRKSNRRRVRSMGEVEWIDGRPGAVVGVIRDVTDEHALARALQSAADTDPLTQISNRGAFTRRLDRAIADAREHATPFALLLLDLDGFKRINDTFGHTEGDEVLRTVARRLQAPWLKGSCSARLGGDEFAVIVEDAGLLADAPALVAALETELQVCITVDGLTLESGASVGLMRFEADRFATARAFMHAADTDLYTAKRRRVGERRAA